MTTRDILIKAKAAAPFLAALDTQKKNAALRSMANALSIFTTQWAMIQGRRLPLFW